MASIDPAGIAAVRTSVERVLGRAPSKPFRTAADFPAYWAAAMKIHGGDDLALRIATEIPVGSFGRTSYAFASAATIGEALNVFRRDSQRAVSDLETRLDINGKLAELRLRGPEPLWPILEILLGILALRCQQLPDPPIKITAVTLPRPAPADPRPWHRLYTVRPRFGADHGSLVIAADLLSRPLRTSDVTVRQALGSEPASSLVDEVRAHLRTWIRDAPDIDRVARALGLSTRTLQRRLGEDGATFRQLVLATKIAVAKDLLERGQLSISDIATAVGFASIPAFSDAFSRTTGKSPSQFRKAGGRDARRR